MTMFPETPTKPSSTRLKPHEGPSSPLVSSPTPPNLSSPSSPDLELGLSPYPQRRRSLRLASRTPSVAVAVAAQEEHDGLDVMERKDRDSSKPDGSDSDSMGRKSKKNEHASRVLDSNAKEKWAEKEDFDERQKDDGGLDLGSGSAESMKSKKRMSGDFDLKDSYRKRSRVVDRSGSSDSDPELENVDVMEKAELGFDGDGAEDSISGACHSAFRKQRYSKEDKGKGMLIQEKSDDDELLKACETLVMLKNDPDVASAKEEARQEAQRLRWKAMRRETHLETARECAPRFAYFNPEVEDRLYHPVPGTEISIAKPDLEDEDLPGPFSATLEMVRKRTKKVKAEEGSSTSPSVVCSSPVIEWEPSQNRDSKSLRQLVPSLQDLCLSVLCEYSEAITSLEGVPDFLRSKFSRSLCDSRKMNGDFLRLIVSGSPYEICLKDGTWMQEEEFQNIFGACNTENLQVLQLDLCGRCMTDYILRDTLAQSPNCLPELTTVSLKAAYRFSDNGLNALVSSAPSLRSINLGHCYFLTSTGINILADNLGSVLKELFLDDCNNLDAMLILPALKKLKQLEVLSVGGIESICDKFVIELMPVCGPNMKELNFADCGKLTDASLKAISRNCFGLRAINLANLKNLTDLALQHLANGCRSLQVFKLCRNAFSDEAIAAFLELSGESLRELSLNNIREVANNTAISLATCCSKTLLILDLSWCRKLKDEALGLIVDKCFSLRLLRLYGCTQVTNTFLDGHSNPLVRIIGLKTMPLLQHLHLPDMISDTLQSELHYKCRKHLSH